ncbi:hypothetical protein DQ384_26390 [Sphaerisporangium album]|uniref:Subtilisin inhibitor domain-containing protein n=1 Tax=Sphaerisporangium album TaxID=509200 RepID=A0A367FBC5_9ACTN|nr:SSI family serine proteinase inhibitor [Sphaerisporangium album]RCG27249.1 hypothetical protein DQ384_26390 [Sphaerisporangium album]
MGLRFSRAACVAAIIAATAVLGQTAADAGSAAGDPPPKDPTATSGAPGAVSSPRSLVLVIHEGRDASTSVVLRCAPQQGGTHPRTAEACALLGTVGGDLRKLKAQVGTACPAMYEPLTVTASGVWDGRMVMTSRTFGNKCEMRSTLGPVADVRS